MPVFSTDTLIDISLPAGPQLPVWPGDPPFSLTRHGSPELHVSSVAFCLHHGTHLDAPAHCIPGGKTIDAYPPARFHLPASVVDCAGRIGIGTDCLASLAVSPGEAVLFRSAFSVKPDFDPNFPYIDEAVAGWLVEQGITLVGIDSPSIERFGDLSLSVHHILLGNDILILEQLALEPVPPGRYLLSCPPLAFPGAEAGPCRALLSPC